MADGQLSLQNKMNYNGTMGRRMEYWQSAANPFRDDLQHDYYTDTSFEKKCCYTVKDIN